MSSGRMVVMVYAGALQKVRSALFRDADDGKVSRREILQKLDAATSAAPEPLTAAPDGWREFLNELEWCATGSVLGDSPLLHWCPVCSKHRDEGHRHDCKLANMLAVHQPPAEQSPVAVLQDAPGLAERAAFESWAEKQAGSTSEVMNQLFGDYAWEAWQARAALQVKGNAAPLTPAPAEIKQDAAVLAEREACAKLCDEQIERWTDDRARYCARAEIATARQDDTELLRKCADWCEQQP